MGLCFKFGADRYDCVQAYTYLESINEGLNTVDWMNEADQRSFDLNEYWSSPDDKQDYSYITPGKPQKIGEGDPAFNWVYDPEQSTKECADKQSNVVGDVDLAICPKIHIHFYRNFLTNSPETDLQFSIDDDVDKPFLVYAFYSDYWQSDFTNKFNTDVSEDRPVYPITSAFRDSVRWTQFGVQPAVPGDDSDGETDTDTDVDDGSDQDPTDGADDGPFTPLLDVELERAPIQQKTPSELLGVEPEELIEALDTFKDSRDIYGYLDYAEIFEYALERPAATETEQGGDRDKIDYRV